MDRLTKEYKDWLSELKLKIRSAQAKAAITINSALISFYWDLGKMISESQTAYGTSFLKQLSKDLKSEFPDMKGFSYRNLASCRQFYQFYLTPSNLQQPVANFKNNPAYASDYDEITAHPASQIPWGHNVLVFSKAESVEEAQFYLQQTIENGWSRDILALQIKSKLYNRQGKAVTNFKETLADPFSDLAQQTLKDPYVFDFLSLETPFKEKDIERQLVTHITKFLLELGKGFAFIGQQYHLEIGETDYYLDLLFYHTKLKCYVVIELKNTKFIPEYAGKLNFYLSAVDTLVKQADDNPTIGILLCRDKNNFETEFALRDINKPMGVSEFGLTESLPENLKSNLPSIEEIEQELNKLNND